MPVDTRIEAELLATCHALGVNVKSGYQKSADCVECLKDLIRYLKRDDEDHSILRQLGSMKLLQNDLLPILKQYSDRKQILDLILRLLVVLTNPALLLFKEELPEDKLSNNIYLEIVGYLQIYKEAFTDVSIWTVLNNCLQKLLENSYADRDEEDRFTVERILIVTRNVLHVTPDYISEKRTDDDVNVHDQVLWALHMSGMEDLLLYLSGSEDEEQYCFHILEIISLMLREHKPETLAGAGNPRSVSEKESDVQRLMALRKKEELAKAQRLKTILPARFNGSFYVKNMKSISDREYISHKLITNTHAVSFDTEKSGRRRPKNRLPVSDNEISRRSTLSVCLFLKNFCVEILNNSYNVLMSLVKKKLLRERSEDHDESYYLWAMSYFMEFNRLNNFQLAFVSETISVQIFHYIQTQLDSFYEMMLSDRKKTKVWSKRMHLGLKSYKELLLTLCAMSNSQDETVVQCASVIKGNIFYVIEYREMLLSLLSNFDEVKFSLAYLKDLVEATHVFLRMLEKHSKKHSHLVVQKKVRKIQKKKKKTVTSHLPPLDDQNEVGWEAISGKLSALLQGRGTIPTDISPFDAASESSIDEQKTEVLYKIFEAMHKEEAGNAVALLRSAREVWPEDNAFGSPDVEPEEEFLALREIFFANLKRTSAAQNEEEEESFPDDDEENEDNYSSTFAEQQLDLRDFFKRFGSPKVVQPYCLLMANYKKNEPHTNLCIVKMLHRIAWDCKMHGLLFQASVFLVFQNVLSDPDQHFDPAIKELARLAKYIVNKFFSAAEKNKKMFVELLFWKGPREVYEIEEGYGSYNSMSSKAAAWTEEEEEELKYLYEENKNVIDDGEDVVEVIRKLMKNKDRTNKQIIHKLKTMGLVENTQSLHPKASRLRNQWLEDEILELQHLFEEYKSSDDILGNLLKYITVTKSKQSVIAKLLELKLITDRKELWKKRAKKQNNSGSRRHAGASGSENDSESGYSDENDVADNTDSDVSNQVKNKDEWDERELEELCTLYAKHKDSPQCIESIASELSFEANLNNVVSKLTEQGLINPDDENVIASLQNAVTSTNSSASHKHKPNKTHTKKDLEKKRSKSKEWHESEIIELNHLFEEHKESGDVMHNIMTNLIIKRPKKSVVEKLLELGLVSDKKDLRKKRATAKTKKNKQSEIPSRQLSSTSKNVSQQEIDGDNIQESSKNVGLALEKLKHRKQQKKKDSSSSAFPSNSTSEQSESTALQSTTEENKRRRHLILGESDSSDDETLSSIKSSLSKSFSKRQISEDKVNSKKIAKGLKSSDTLKLKKKQQHVLNDTDSSEDEALIHIKSSQKGRPNDTVLGADKTEDMATVSKRKRSALMDDSSSSDNETLNNIQAALSKDHSIEPSVEERLNSKSVGRSVSEKPRRKHRVLDSDSSEDEILSEVKSSVKDLQSTDLISSENDPPESGTSEVRASEKFSSDSRVEVSRENAGSFPISNLGGSGSFVKETSNDITSAVQDGSISEVNLNRTFDNETNVSQEGSDVLLHNSSNNTVAQSEVRNNILKDRNSQLAVQELLFCSTDSLMTNHAVLDSVPGDINPVIQKLPSYHPADETVGKKHKKRHSVLDESDSSENEEFSRKTLVKKKRVQILDDSD